MLIKYKLSQQCSTLICLKLECGSEAYCFRKVFGWFEDVKLLMQVAKRLENTSRYLKRLGSFGFWGQLVCTIVAAVILSFSIVVTGKVTSPATFYATAGGIAAGFISVFWSFGYIRLSDRLKRTANNPVKVIYLLQTKLQLKDC